MVPNHDKAVLRLENVSVTYPNGHTAISGVTAELHGGNICGLIGMNGSGKSTLFKCMMGFVKPTTGFVQINQMEVKAALKQHAVAYVPQSEDVDWHFPVLVEDVVMMGRYGHMGFFRIPTAADRDSVDRALERVNMTAFRKRQIGELSGGQKKRVFVARALAQEAAIILLDEPFTGVDTTTEDALIKLFRALAKEGHLIVVSTHNLGSVPEFCNDVMLINSRLLAHGPVKTTFTQSNLAVAFGGMLRQHQIGPDRIHSDEDQRSVSVLTDEERPLVFYGEDSTWDIVNPKHTGKSSKSTDSNKGKKST